MHLQNVYLRDENRTYFSVSDIYSEGIFLSSEY